jgi:hypothetical protein
VPRGCEPGGYAVDVIDQQGRMRLGGWSEGLLDSDVQLDARVTEPHSPTSRQRWRLRHFGEAEQLAVERSSRGLAAHWARDLDMVQTGHGYSWETGPSL